jgi:hypothetical protein
LKWETREQDGADTGKTPGELCLPVAFLQFLEDAQFVGMFLDVARGSSIGDPPEACTELGRVAACPFAAFLPDRRVQPEVAAV